MVAEQPPCAPHPSGLEWPLEWEEEDQSRNIAIREEHRRNLEYRNAHIDELCTRFPNQFVLIYDGDVVESFGTLEELGRRRSELEPLLRVSAEEVRCAQPRVVVPAAQFVQRPEID